MFIRYRTGVELSRTGNFGPYDKELNPDQFSTFSFKDKKEKKTNSVKFSTNKTKIVATWDSLCGRSMAIFINDGANPAKVLDHEQLKPGRIELEVGSCQVFQTGNIFAEIFLTETYPGGNNYYEQSNLKHLLVTKPDIAGFGKIQLNNGTIIQAGHFQGNCLKSYDFQISLWNKNDREDELPILQKLISLPSDLNAVFENFGYIEPCTEYVIRVGVVYELWTGEQEQLILLTEVLKTNSAAGFKLVVPRISLEENSLKLEGQPCNFKYSLSLRNKLTGVLDAVPGLDSIVDGALPLKNLSNLMVRSINSLLTNHGEKTTFIEYSV